MSRPAMNSSRFSRSGSRRLPAHAGEPSLEGEHKLWHDVDHIAAKDQVEATSVEGQVEPQASSCRSQATNNRARRRLALPSVKELKLCLPGLLQSLQGPEGEEVLRRNLKHLM